MNGLRGINHRGSDVGQAAPYFLTGAEFQPLLPELSQRERVIVLVAGSTGLRRREPIALRWEDIDFELSQASVTHAIWNNIESDVKSEEKRVSRRTLDSGV